MINSFLDFLKFLGLSQKKLKLIALFLLVSVSTYYLTTWKISYDQKTKIINDLAESFDRLEKKLDEKFSQVDTRLSNLEVAVSDLSTFNEKASKESVEFLKAYVQDNTKMAFMYKQTISRIEELQKDYLPTQKGFKEKLEDIKINVKKFEKTN